MDTIRNWLLPLTLAVGQMTLLWAGTDLTGGPLSGTETALLVLAATAVECTALGWRRRRPLRALAGTLAASLLGKLTVQGDYPDIGILVALFSVAVRCRSRVTAWATGAVVLHQELLMVTQDGMSSGIVTDLAVTALIVSACAGAGEAWRQWTTGRWAAVRRLAQAEDGGRRAADSERHRLGRELHDISAHHLTSVVVTVEAARRLGESRPELADEALSFAERTGRETRTALQRLVEIMRTMDEPDPQLMSGRIEELVAGFGLLGRPIQLELPPDVAGPAAEAVFGITREALTNALRYAPGAAVRVQVRRDDGVLEVTIDNAAPRNVGRADGSGLGSGRGIAGMRERAAAVGGELSAGPSKDGGWRVWARLPDSAGPRRQVSARRSRFLRSAWLTSSWLVAAVALLPVMFVLFAAQEGLDVAGPGGPAVLVVLVAVHALPLLWRRHRPWAALIGVAATAWLWPLARVSGLLPSPMVYCLMGGAVAEAVAVYAVAAYGAGARRTWPAPTVAGTSLAAVVAMTAVADGTLWGVEVSPFDAVLLLCALAVPAWIFLTCVWGVGAGVRARRLRVLAREDTAVTDSVRRAAVLAESERRRVADGLREAVLEHTERVVASAANRRLDEVACEARAALEAMRELLHRLSDEGETEWKHAPQPTLSELEGLCRTLRNGGRRVTLKSLPEPAGELPMSVALAAYRVVEAALGAGDREAARVVLRRRRDELLIVVSGVRLAVAGPVSERLRVQTDAAGGRISFDRAGTVRVSLPAELAPAPVEEASPSPYE
ncbi:histidine kinase [Streptomyces cavernae]|uniref:histidine kinase n=1 Tax=Streptomyces cavernae TaxID=2259034 RepID=UPI000FEBDB4A|nr:histidine kinase [Streptomyces cavernae]